MADLLELGAPDVAGVAAFAGVCRTAHQVDQAVVGCRACPRLVAWREQVAETKRKSYAGEPYWGRPVPSWGPADASIAVVGLAPAAHGGNRTGRIFTGDRSGDWLFAALHRAGLAAIPTSVSAADDQRLIGTRILAAVHCAPPDNKPTPLERDACRSWLARDLALLAPTLRSVLVLGGFAWNALWPALRNAGYRAPAPRPAFGHGVEVGVEVGVGASVRLGDDSAVEAGAESLSGSLSIFGCYHPSQQNTFTGRLTAGMLDDVMERVTARVSERAVGRSTPRVARAQQFASGRWGASPP